MVMDYKEIEQLLQRYWACETSLEEEARLRSFFNGNEVPRHLLRYKDLFAYQKQQGTESLGHAFDERLLSMLDEPRVVKARRMTLASRFAPLLKAAAVVALIAGLGGTLQRSFFGDMQEVVEGDTIGEQITAPSVAKSDEALPDVAGGEARCDSLSQSEPMKRPSERLR